LALCVREIDVDASGVVRPFVVAKSALASTRKVGANRNDFHHDDDDDDDVADKHVVGLEQAVDVVAVDETKPNQLQIVWRALRQKALYRLGLLTLLLTCVRLVFRHLDATFPKYVQRYYCC
jgi:hypothetical protein